MIASRASTVRSRASRVGLALLPVALVLTTGCDPPGKPRPGQQPVPADAVLDFDALFAANCAGCHGASGKLGPAPPLDDPLFLKIVPDDVLADVIRHGRRDTPMPGFSRAAGGTLTDEQIAVLASGLKPKWLAANQQTPPDPPPYLATQTDPSSAIAEGQKLFARDCAMCHGETGHGGSAGAINDVAFLSLASDQLLRRIVITGRADLGMPNFADPAGRDDDFKPLTSEQVSAIVALLAQWREGTTNPTAQTATTTSTSGGAR